MQSTYTTTNGTVNLFAGLTNLTSATAINTTNQATGISYITDPFWSTTGILNLGVFSATTPIPGGTLAGTFGGGTYFAATNRSILLIGGYNETSTWGGWTVCLLLSNDTYSSAISYSNSVLTQNPIETIARTNWYNNASGALSLVGPFPTLYQQLDIAACDTNNIGVKGIELSSLEFNFPDISYVGVAEVVPEPSTYALLALSAAGLGGYVLRRRRK